MLINIVHVLPYPVLQYNGFRFLHIRIMKSLGNEFPMPIQEK